MQRQFIKDDRKNAEVSGSLYANFKTYIEVKYPNGIAEEDWINILQDDEVHITISF